MFMTAHAVSSANPQSLRGMVQTGGTSSSQPLPNVQVTLFEATDAATRQCSARRRQMLRVGSRIPYRKNNSSSIFFVKADVGEGVEFVTVLGSNLPAIGRRLMS